MLKDILARVEQRLQTLGVSASKASAEAGLSQDAIRNMRRSAETDQRTGISTSTLLALAPVLETTGAWLLEGVGPEKLGDVLVPIIGHVGADPSGRIIRTEGQLSGDRAPVPPGGTERAVALEVRGHSMRGLADDGALVYFEEQHTKPTRDMIGQVVVVELKSGEVLVKRLLRGSAPDVWDLESLVGPMLQDVAIEWAAEITAIIPPLRARKIIRRGGADEAA